MDELAAPLTQIMKSRAVEQKTRYTNRKENGLCIRCGKPIVQGLSQCDPCRTVRNKYHIKLNQQLKQDVFRAYGGEKCSCCGETEISFLAIDHINGGGEQQRKKIGGGTAFYRWLKRNKYPVGFQVLCHNCNHGKHINGGICPHKRPR